jgi:hypothetical protein
MAALTDLRRAVALQLAATLEIEFVDGKLDGRQTRELGCTFPGGRSEVDADTVLYEVRTVFVRIYQRYEEVRNPQKPADPSRLEQLADRLLDAVGDIQSGTGGAWFFRVPTVEIDMDDQGLEATVTAWGENQFRTGG